VQVAVPAVLADPHPADELLARLAEVLPAALAVIRKGDVPERLSTVSLSCQSRASFLPLPYSTRPVVGCCLSLNDFSTCLPLTQ